MIKFINEWRDGGYGCCIIIMGNDSDDDVSAGRVGEVRGEPSGDRLRGGGGGVQTLRLSPRRRMKVKHLM